MKTQHETRGARCAARVAVASVMLALLIGGAEAYVASEQYPVGPAVPAQIDLTQSGFPNVNRWQADSPAQQLASWRDYAGPWTIAQRPSLRSVMPYDASRWLTAYGPVPRPIGVQGWPSSTSMPHYRALEVGWPAYRYQMPVGPRPLGVRWPGSASVPHAGVIQPPIARAIAPDNPCGGRYP